MNGLVGFASLVVNEELYLGSIGIMTRPEGGYRLVYPSKKIGDRNINYFYPINHEIGKLIEEKVVEKVNEVLSCYDNRSSSNY